MLADHPEGAARIPGMVAEPRCQRGARLFFRCCRPRPLVRSLSRSRPQHCRLGQQQRQLDFAAHVQLPARESLGANGIPSFQLILCRHPNTIAPGGQHPSIGFGSTRRHRYCCFPLGPPSHRRDHADRHPADLDGSLGDRGQRMQ